MPFYSTGLLAGFKIMQYVDLLLFGFLDFSLSIYSIASLEKTLTQYYSE